MLFRRKKIPEKLNICLTTYKFPLSERTSEYGFLFPVAKGLAQAGHKVTVLTSMDSAKAKETNRDGVQFYFLNPNFKTKSSFPSEVRKKFTELHKKEPFDIVHSLDSSGNGITKRKKLYKIATAFDIRGTQISQLFSIMAMRQESFGSQLKTDFAMLYKYLRTYWGSDRKILRSADGIFVSSPQERIILERYYFYPDARIYTVPYGVQFKTDLNPQAIQTLKDKFQLTSDHRCVTTLSDMTDIDDLKNLLKAFQKVAIKKPDSRLIILGSGPKMFELEYEVLNLALGNKVILAGAVSEEEIYNFISISDVFVNLSLKSTGFEPSLLLAMALEKTIIGSEISAISSIVEDGTDGFLVRPADSEALFQLLLDIFRGQLNTSEIGTKASLKVKELFDPEKMVQNTLNSYRLILSR